jgi:hypothetical protein
MFKKKSLFEEIKRIPLKYSESPTDYRRDRLPSDTDYADMQLTDGARIKEGQAEYTQTLYIWQLLFSVAGTILLVFVGPHLPLRYLIPLSFVVSLVALLRVLLQPSSNKMAAIMMALIVPPGAIAFSCYFGTLLAFRTWASSVLVIPAAATLIFFARAPFALWRDALLNDVRITPQQRQEASPILYKPDILFLVLVSLAAIFIPIWSPFCALATVILVVTAFLSYRLYQARSNDPTLRFRDLLSLAITIAVFPPTYQAQYRPYPGTWNPRADLQRAERSIYSTLISWALFLTVALSGYSAWDTPFIRSHFLALFHGGLPSSSIHMAIVSSLAPAVNWNQLPPPYSPPQGALTTQQFFKTRQTMSAKEKSLAFKVFSSQLARRSAAEAAIDRFVTPALNSSPYLWVYLSWISFFTGGFSVSLLWLLAVLFAVFVPATVLVVALFSPLCSALALQREVQSLVKADQEERTEWQSYVDRIRVSTHVTKDPITSGEVREAEHLFMGHEPVKGFPILLDRSILVQHAYILGGTGFGKTTMGVMPLVMQLIQGHRDKNGAITPMPPMLIIDLKGDLALFHTVKAEVERKAREEGRSITDAFRVFSCALGHACHSFNPFVDLHQGTVELCNVYLDALNLNHGEGYGRSYYTMQSRSLLREVLMKKKPKTFKELYEGLQLKQKTKVFREAYELVATIEALGDYEHIYNPEDPKKVPTIHMPTVVRERQVVYFWLPAAEHSLTAKEIASLALYAFYNAQREWVNSGKWKGQGKPRPEAFLVIDEFQRVASRNFPNILREARSFGMGTILAHQSASDLELPDVDLATIVRENTRLKLFFAIQDPKERKLFSELSGDELAIQPSISYSFQGKAENPESTGTATRTTISYRPIVKPRITKNDIIESGDHPFEYLMLVSQGAGYTQFGGYPIAVRTSYPISRSVYGARREQPWPTKDELGLPESVQVTTKPIEATDAKRLETIAAYDAGISNMLDNDPSLLH